jgi:methanethiol S-methyltransferase
MIQRVAIFLYGIIAYVSFLGTFLYAVGFIGNLIVPKAIDGDPQMAFDAALLIDGALLMLFALQHSVMARRGFKQWLTRFIPQAAERSTYVVAANLALIAMFVFWQPLGGSIWHVEDPVGRIVLYAIFGVGWTIVFITTFLINHFDLFGLRQVWANLRGVSYESLSFRTPVFYRFVRHPLYFGFLCAFWATPTMSLTHLLFAIATTGYILVAIQLEEKDLIREHGGRYVNYKEAVPMLIPALKSKRSLGS